MKVRFPDPPKAGRTVLEVDSLGKSYGDNVVFSDVTFDVGRGERLLVMGLNGAGKTSLLRILAGVSEPNAGSVSFGLNVVPGYYAQEHEGIVSGRTLLDHVREASPELGDEFRRSLLGMFGLTGEKVFQDAITLSGGEKTKLALTQLVAGRHNLLLLDEPTNNLDPRIARGHGRCPRRLAGHHRARQPRRGVRAAARARPRAAPARRRLPQLERRPLRARVDGLGATPRRSGRAARPATRCRACGTRARGGSRPSSR